MDAERGVLTCRYELDGREFTERVTLPPGEHWHTGQARAAARLVFLLSGVSYYKTAAPPVIDFGTTALTQAEESFLREFYLQGLAEFAYRNHLELTPLHLRAQRAPDQPPAPPGPTGPRRALVPFGGGIDSIVTVEQVRRQADVALFVVSRPADRFDAIEQPAAVTGLPVVRAEREIDPQLLRSAELGFLNGHVPVTGILSAIAVLAAVLTGRGIADARGHVELAPVEDERRPQHLPQLLGDLGGVLDVVDRLDEDRELVAPEASQGVALPHVACEAPRDLPEQAIARRVAQAVVDHLEPVEVEEQHRDPGARAPSPGQRGEQTVLQQVAVGQAGERHRGRPGARRARCEDASRRAADSPPRGAAGRPPPSR